VVLYEMLTGRQPFRGNTNADTLVAVLEREPARIFETSRRSDRWFAEIQEVVQRSLQKDPAQRYQNVTEMLSALNKLSNQLFGASADRSSPITTETQVKDLGEVATQSQQRLLSREKLLVALALLGVLFFAGALALKQRWLKKAASPATGTPIVQKSYLQMTENERFAFVAKEEQRISAMMGDHPVKLNDEAIAAIKRHVDRYAGRSENMVKPGQDSLPTIYARAVPLIPTISRAFRARKIPVVVGIYLPMIESEYRPCFENEAGAKGLFQFLPVTAERYGVPRSEMCDVDKVAPAAAHYLADRMAELGDDSQSMTLVLLSYNRGADAVRDALRQLRESDANYERNFWTLFANRQKLDATFQRESSGYVPNFFAAAIVGENPEVFDLHLPPLSKLASE
jgi:hypothetical protein